MATYLYEIAGLICLGKNQIAIEVTTTLEREHAAAKREMRERVLERKVKGPTGITGVVKLYAKEQKPTK